MDDKIDKLVNRILESEKGSYINLSLRYSLNKLLLRNMSKEGLESIDGINLTKETKEIRDKMIAMQDNIGSYSDGGNGNYESIIENQK